MPAGGGRPATASGTGDIDTGNGILFSFALSADTGNATAVLRSGGSGGTIIAKLSAVTGTTAARLYVNGLGYSGGLHLTLTGSGAPFVDLEL